MLQKKSYPIYFLAVWTLVVTASLLFNLHGVYKDTAGKALIEARTILQHNLAYRRWNVSHGGIYARVSDFNQPNPYVVAEDKNLTTTEGIKLSLIHPFQMTKQAHDLLRDQSPSLPILNRTVSLTPLNPENTPDNWEKEALFAIKKGKREVSEITEIQGLPYLRLLSPYFTEQECIKCHAKGHEVGDLRGGMSVSVPLAPYYETDTRSRNYIIITHIILWGIGTLTIILFFAAPNKNRHNITESENTFRVVSEHSHNVEYWIKENNEIVYISPSCERITGYAGNEFYENPELLNDIIHPDDIENYKQRFTDFKSSVHEDFQYRIISKNRETRWVSHSCHPMYVEGEFLGRRGSIKDITNQKHLEEQRIQERNLECLSRFAGGTGHDFNNILSSINTFTHLIEQELHDSDTDLNDYVKYLNIASTLGKNITSNLLAFGRPQAVNFTTTKLNSVINNISEVLQSVFTEGIECNVSLAEDEIPIFADPQQIEQAIINLCINARDAIIEEGTITIKTERVTINEKKSKPFLEIPSGKYMTLSVSDTGHGIHPEDLPKIYEPFFSTKKRKVIGLGLVIIHDIVKQHNGYIDVDSDADKGTTFTLFFPVSAKEVAEPLATRDGATNF